ncbi:unnamed protein product [Spirodela intermedia]|uniref:B box-type domain-containing protein n=1 Tax=Spirodela intermedia TaxID=51605 RepID=A0A7I8JQH2_SPIIN|nr:unnamed protein product [Spirodela intermedia]CAA6672011.1 unnamed protein product [Spirodela intermedia]
MVRKKCELCGMAARTRCESDEADLCWECDAEVHGANFLVARHLRSLLCRTCQGPTPWRAEGPRLGPSVSVCLICFRRREEAACGASEKGKIGGGAPGRSPIGEEEDEEDMEDMEECDRSDDDDGTTRWCRGTRTRI